MFFMASSLFLPLSLSPSLPPSLGMQGHQEQERAAEKQPDRLHRRFRSGPEVRGGEVRWRHARPGEEEEEEEEEGGVGG